MIHKGIMNLFLVFLASFCEFSFLPGYDFDFLPSWLDNLCPDKRVLRLFNVLVFSLLLLQSLFVSSVGWLLLSVFCLRAWIFLLLMTTRPSSKILLASPLCLGLVFQWMIEENPLFWFVVAKFVCLLLFSLWVNRYHRPTSVPRTHADSIVNRAMRYRKQRSPA